LNTGSYHIYLALDKPIRLKIGALGLYSFEPGLYIYTGSAMKNLLQRVARHKSRNKLRRWHIDYLTSNKNFKIIKIEIFESDKREECQRNASLLENSKAEIPIKRFGSSDCKCCPAHLVYFAEKTI